MRPATYSDFMSSLKPGDIGIINSSNFFGWLQNLYRKRFREGSLRASHGFILKIPPKVSEANGITVSGSATVTKYVGDSTECWIFRYLKLTPEQLDDINAYENGAEETGGHYSIWGILQFAKSFFTGKKDEKDESGVFCTEYTSRCILAGGITDYITTVPPWQIDPSSQLNWFMTDGIKMNWILAAHYDGKGNYEVA